VPVVTILCGAVLVVIGLDGYADVVGLVRPHLTHQPTALIPVFFGAVLVLCGLAAFRPSLLKHAMHLAATVGLIGLVAGAAMGLPKLPRLLAGESHSESFRPSAVRSQLWTAGVCLVFVVLCVNSFIQARRRRQAAQSPPAAAGG
jgi:hypothetical protein